MAATADPGFSLFGKGPFHGLTQRLHLVDAAGKPRVARVVAIAWLPMLLGDLLPLARGLPVDPLIGDFSVHARFLVALPLLLVSSVLLEKQCAGAVMVAYRAKLAEPAVLDPILGRAERLRDSAWVELAIALAALTIGQLGEWGIGFGPTGIFHGISSHPEWSLVRVWYGTIAFPLWQFLSARWLWRWAIWCYLLVRLSRVPLDATAAHPDHAAGLGCFAWPLAGYAWYVAAFSSVIAGAEMTHYHTVTMSSLWPSLVILVVAAIIVGYGPLLAFTPQLYATKRRDLAKNTLLGFTYMRDFDAKWFGGTTDTLLGSQDIQALNDFGGAFQMVLTTRLTVFEPLRMKNIVIAVVLPMVPLLVTLVPLKSVVPKIFGVLIGG